MVLWPNSLIAGIYDSMDTTGPVAKVDYVGNRERKGEGVRPGREGAVSIHTRVLHGKRTLGEEKTV